MWAEGVAGELNALREVTDEGVEQLKREERREELERVVAWQRVKDLLVDFYASEEPLRHRGRRLARAFTRWMAKVPIRPRVLYDDGLKNVRADLGAPAVVGVLWRLVDTGGLGALRLCRGCARFFVDHTKNQYQKWCSQRCKNRVNVARHRRTSQGRAYRRAYRWRHRAYQLWRKHPDWSARRISREIRHPEKTSEVWAFIEEWKARAGGRR